MPDAEADTELHADLTKLFNEPPEPSPDPAPVAEPEPSGDPAPVAEPSQEGRARDEQGRFVKTPEEQAAEAAQPPEGAAPAQVERIAPPPNWKGAGKTKWDLLPRDIQQELAADYKRISETEGRFTPLAQILEPRRAALSAQYGSVENAVSQLFQLSDYAARNPQEFIQWFAQQRNIDLGSLGSGRQEQPNDPFQTKINQLEQTVSSLATQIQQSQSSVHEREVQAFASDPNHPYFNDVANDMVAFVQSGKSLQEAYDMAVWANPNTRQQLLTKQQQEEELKRRQKTEQARQAAASISGSPVPGTGDEPSNDLRGELLKNFGLRA